VLAGPLPTEIGHLSRLTALSIDFLLATEVIMIPSEVSLLSNIRHLYVVGIVIPSDTWLTDSLVAMTGLTWLHIASQRVSTKQKSSTLPTQIGLLTTLVSISLFNAGIAGTLPTEFARLTKLTFLELWSNDLSGTVPTEIGLLTDLVVLNLPDNPMLTGFVPSEVGALTNLSKLDFQGTSISVQFPPEVCALGVEVTMSELDKDVDACK
jgi:Leucine-rich repeat (LRR) protein